MIPTYNNIHAFLLLGFFSHTPRIKSIKWLNNECNQITNKMHWDEKILSDVNSKLEEFLYSSRRGNECNNYEISPRAFLLPVNNSLRKLQLEGAQLNSSVFKEILKLNDFSSLTYLNVERNSLEDIPNLKTNLSNLEKLFVGHNPNLSCECPTLYNLQDMKDILYLNEYRVTTKFSYNLNVNLWLIGSFE